MDLTDQAILEMKKKVETNAKPTKKTKSVRKTNKPTVSNVEDTAGQKEAEKSE